MTTDDLTGVDGNDRFEPLIYSVDMRRTVLPPIHLDHNAIKDRNCRHNSAHPASAVSILAQLRVPLWKLVRSYFSFGECTRSSSSAKPTMIVSMPSTRLKSATIGIEPPSPTVTALWPHSAVSAARAFASAGLSNGSWIGGARPKLANSTLASTGRRARTKARNAS